MCISACSILLKVMKGSDTQGGLIYFPFLLHRPLSIKILRCKISEKLFSYLKQLICLVILLEDFYSIIYLYISKQHFRCVTMAK